MRKRSPGSKRAVSGSWSRCVVSRRRHVLGPPRRWRPLRRSQWWSPSCSPFPEGNISYPRSHKFCPTASSTAVRPFLERQSATISNWGSYYARKDSPQGKALSSAVKPASQDWGVFPFGRLCSMGLTQNGCRRGECPVSISHQLFLPRPPFLLLFVLWKPAQQVGCANYIKLGFMGFSRRRNMFLQLVILFISKGVHQLVGMLREPMADGCAFI